MTPKQILDSFTETLMCDERILSPRERALLTNLLQHAKNASSGDKQTQERVHAVIASAVGETVAQRAFSALGSSIVERILADPAATRVDGSFSFREISLNERAAITPGVPTPPGPQPPGSPVRTPRVPAPGPQPPASPLIEPVVPPPSGPQTPGHGKLTTIVSKANVAVIERSANLAARCVVLDEFLAPQEVDELMRFTLEHEAEFQASEVVSPTSERGVVNYEHRRSRVLMNLGRYEQLMLARIKGVLPQILEKLGMRDFDISSVETQITASNDGDFFHFHSDNGEDRVVSRHLTFVYFFHREPKAFEGGELRIHDAHLEESVYVTDGSYQTITPRQNQIVFFPCELMHEITPVKCASQAFSDSRFTINGWLRR
jgi:Rps23 Pro-64 3,4-dihydroxylase Tpa1-like proline 4-hydroxylase